MKVETGAVLVVFWR